MGGTLNRLVWAFMATVGLVATFADTAAAQSAESAVIRGRVSADGGGKPLSGVTVELGEAGRRTVTDERGAFRFGGVVPGVYTLRFTLIGHAVREERVEVGAGEGWSAEVDLGVNPVALEPLLVLLDRTRLAGSGTADLPGSAHVIGPRALEERKTAFDDVHQILREVPGVHVQEEEGYGLRPNIGMRGAGSDRSAKITLMEDGVLAAPAPYAAPSAYYFPVVGRMEAVEVRKGSSQVRHGPFTVGGALNLVSSSIPANFSLLVDGSGGEQSTRKLMARIGDSSEHFGWLVESYRLGTSGFKQLDGGGPTGFDVQDYVGKVRLNTALDAGVYHEVQLKFGYYDETSDETYLGLTAGDFATSPLRRYAGSQEDVMRADQQQINVRHFARAGAFDLTTTVYQNTFARNWYKLQSVSGASIASVLDEPDTHEEAIGILRGADAGANALRVRANNRSYDARGVQTAAGLATPLAGGHNLELGARYHEDSEDRFQHEDGYSMQDGRMALTTAGAPGSQENRVGVASAWSFYVQDRFQMGRLTVSPGVRYETIEFERRDHLTTDPTRQNAPSVRTNSVSAWIPGIGANFELSPELRLIAGVHRGFAPPGPGADGETKPEFSINYEGGARFTSSAGRLEAIGFFNDYTNILGVETLSSGSEGTGNLFNGGDVHTWGLELSGGTELPLGTDWRLPFDAAYTYTSSVFRSDFSSDYEAWGTVNRGDELPYVPSHQLFNRVGLERDGFGAHLTTSYVSAMRTIAGSGPIASNASTDAHLVFGAVAEYDLTPFATLYGGVANVTDRRYVVARRPAGLRPGLPRTVQLGLRVAR